jgi:chromosome partitioning protein
LRGDSQELYPVAVAQIISIINLKGGVGKTTLAMMFGEFLASVEQKVLLIDMDSQANLTTAMTPGTETGASIYSYLTARIGGEIKGRDEIKKWVDSKKDRWVFCSNIWPLSISKELQLIPSEIELGDLDDQFLKLAFARSEGKETPLKWPQPYFLLDDLTQVLKDEYDFILIDCPPNLSVWTANAIVISDRIIVPVVPEEMSMQGLKLVERRVNQLCGDPGKNANVTGLPELDEKFFRELKERGLADKKDPNDPFYGGNKEWVYSEEDTTPPGMFLGTVINKFDRRRRNAVKEFNKIFHEFATYRPFYNYLADIAPFYALGDYNYAPWVSHLDSGSNIAWWDALTDKWGKGLSEKSEEMIDEETIKRKEKRGWITRVACFDWVEEPNESPQSEQEVREVDYIPGRGEPKKTFIQPRKEFSLSSFPPVKNFPTEAQGTAGIFCTLANDKIETPEIKLPKVVFPDESLIQVFSYSIYRKEKDGAYRVVVRCANLVEEIFGIPIFDRWTREEVVKKWARLKPERREKVRKWLRLKPKQ